ncbi:hypothetical protein ACNHKD_04270 [Methylocystis sp. JAN1]|uniref:hypothetical protein n=1 Tax=Methylocystis sp. JAN1 TaxID=3397211 RepID=UPI003FA1D489
MTLQFETPDEPPTLTTAQAPAPLGDIFQANREAQEYDAISFGRRNAMVDATAARLKSIKDATGQDVPNPYQGGFMEEAMAAYANENPRFRSSPLDPQTDAAPSPYRHLTADDMPRINELQMQAFQDHLAELARKFPERADIIGAGRPISRDAIELANKTSSRAAALNSATTGLLPATTAFLGAMVGSFRDPVQAAALFVGGPEIMAAKSTLGRIAVEGVRQAVVNAGIAAASQPNVQSWRAERGQEAGLLPAAHEIGLNALFGLIPGAGMEAGKIGWAKYVSPRLAREALAGDEAAARQIAESIPREEAPEIHAAVEAARLDDAARAQPLPEGVHPQAADLAYDAAMRRAEDSAEPLPEIVNPFREPAAALEAVKDAETPMQAVEALRQAPEAAIEAAAGSRDPHLVEAGRIASLGDEAFEMVRRGDVHPVIASEVAARVVASADQAAILKDVAELHPTSRLEAAQFVSDAMDRQATPVVQKLLFGADAQGAAEIEPRRRLEAPEKETETTRRIANLEKALVESKPVDDPKWASVAAARDELVAHEPREGLFARIVSECPIEGGL